MCHNASPYVTMHHLTNIWVRLAWFKEPPCVGHTRPLEKWNRKPSGG